MPVETIVLMWLQFRLQHPSRVQERKISIQYNKDLFDTATTAE